MSDRTFLNNKHLMCRAGFGPRLDQIDILESESTDKMIKSMLSERPFVKIEISSTTDDNDYQTIAKLDAEQRKKANKRNRALIFDLNQKFLNEMVTSDDQLREKMAFFWHGHFAARVQNAKSNEQLINVIRDHGLKNFKNLLFQVSKSPAMLQYLNNQQNKKGHPNENFAREVMELFTMGRGNYTEDDIKESARAFTGWGFNMTDGFIFRKNQHDNGIKRFLGKSGNFTGDDILNIILDQKSTAQFITVKIYKFFVNEVVDQEIIKGLSDSFYYSGYDLRNLMHDIFTSDWFYEPNNIGNRIKSPIELIVGIMRILPMQIGNMESLLAYQKLLGQVLFSPPNVAGWPMGKSWIDSSSLLLRMQLPQIMSGLRPLDLTPQADDDLDMGIKDKQNIHKMTKKAKINIDWEAVELNFSNGHFYKILLQNYDSDTFESLNDFADNTLRSKVINIMSTPEYQLG